MRQSPHVGKETRIASLNEKLDRFARDLPFNIVFETLAVTEEQIAQLELSTRPHKRQSSADKLWPHDFACELDAIPADTLRAMVQDAIELHLPANQLAILKIAEESEREQLNAFVRRRN
jgi:hypothetical protein